ncbi:IclR family transcriptional regulator [Salibacterium aidingense]|uniref:IclR family transcriptional regulator n=1 Tax=Salibacterium aidingense TaxID=384933 RepID=UPI003BB9F5E2
MNNSDQQHHSSLENALHVLKSFSEAEPELGVSDLAKELNLGVSTTHRLLTTLADEDFVVKNKQTNKYTLGLSVLQLTNTVTEQLHIIRESTPVLKKLTEETRESSHIGIIDKEEVIYLQKVDSQHPVRLDSHLGKRNPLHCTTSGLAILAFQSKDFIQEKLSGPLDTYTPYTIIDRKSLDNKLTNIQESGYAVCNQEFETNIFSIGAPVFKNRKTVIASINIAGPVQRIKPYEKTMANKVSEASIQLSHLIQRRHKRRNV